MSSTKSPFRINVGFIVHQTVGYSRDFPFEYPSITLPPDLNLKNLTGTLRVTRTAQGLLLQALIQAETTAECARCLEEFTIKLETDSTELYAFSANSVTDSELILPENGILDFTPILREEMLLAMPISPICRPDCKGLCSVCGENKNHGDCNHEEEEIDPRLDILKSFLEENN